MVFLIKPNIGKTLGNLLTRWGKDSHRILVLDEVDRRDTAQVLRAQTPLKPTPD